MDYALIPPRYRSTYFSHIFGASGGYSGQYYGYLWSEVLARDSENWMNAHGGLRRENGDFLRAKVLSRGSSAQQDSLFREFYGAAPDPQALLDFRGMGQASAP
jgi:peptidyl-dipeptidase Dcp